MAKKMVHAPAIWQKLKKNSNEPFSFSLKRSLIVGLVLVLTVVPRFWRLNYPTLPYFDEPYHLGAVRLIMRKDPRAYEWWHQLINDQAQIDSADAFQSHDWLHPPLAKLIQAVSISWFEDNGWGWRLPSAVAGCLLIGACYLLARQISQNWFSTPLMIERTALLSSLMMALDGLVLVQSRIMMNDILMCLWLVLMIYFLTRWQPRFWSWQFIYQKREAKALALSNPENLLVAGVFLGLALATKWSACLPASFFFISLIVMTLKNRQKRVLPLILFSFVGLPTVIYLFSYGQMFGQGKSLYDWWQLHQQTWWYQTHRQENHLYASKPIEWLLNWRPVWYWTDTNLSFSPAMIRNDQNGTTANIYALGNPVLHGVGLMAIIYWLKQLTKMKISGAGEQNKSWSGVILMAYLSTWLPWIFSPRVMFYYHYLPALPLLSLIISRFLIDLSILFSKKAVVLLVLLIGLNFLIFLPHWLGIEVPLATANRWFLALPSWR